MCCDSQQMNKNWLLNVDSDSPAEKWRSHLLLVSYGQLPPFKSILRLLQEVSVARLQSISLATAIAIFLCCWDYNLFPHVSRDDPDLFPPATSRKMRRRLHGYVLGSYWVFLFTSCLFVCYIIIIFSLQISVKYLSLPPSIHCD